jgi:hypothetical protein
MARLIATPGNVPPVATPALPDFKTMTSWIAAKPQTSIPLSAASLGVAPSPLVQQVHHQQFHQQQQQHLPRAFREANADVSTSGRLLDPTPPSVFPAARAPTSASAAAIPASANSTPEPADVPDACNSSVSLQERQLRQVQQRQHYQQQLALKAAAAAAAATVVIMSPSPPSARAAPPPFNAQGMVGRAGPVPVHATIPPPAGGMEAAASTSASAVRTTLPPPPQHPPQHSPPGAPTMGSHVATPSTAGAGPSKTLAMLFARAEKVLTYLLLIRVTFVGIPHNMGNTLHSISSALLSLQAVSSKQAEIEDLRAQRSQIESQLDLLEEEDPRVAEIQVGRRPT